MNDLSQYFHEQRMQLLDFMSMDTAGLSVAAIKERLLGFYSSYNVMTANLESARVYRVRRIDPGTVHTKCADVWHPPAEDVAKIGRANDIRQAMLYCSLDPQTAIDETQIKEGERFSLAIYQLRGRDPYDARSIVIKETKPVPGNAVEFSRFGSELSRFMINEFTRPVSEGNEHHYKRSCAIAQILLELPCKDSLVYPSVRNREAVNVVYTSKAAAETLAVVQVATCEMEKGRAVRVDKLWLPDAKGSLIAQSPPHPMPAPLRFAGSPPKFSDLFHDSKIATPEEIVNYHLANKSIQRTLLRGATDL